MNKTNIEKGLHLIGGRISPFVVLFGLVANIFSLFPRFKIPIIIILFVSAACIVAYTIWRIVESSKTRDLRSKVDILEQEVCKGLKMIRNDAMVTMDMSAKKYRLEFKKEYDIISETPKWYSGQFYCNKVLYSAENAQDYYEEHKVSWDDLNVRAHVQYKNPESDDWEPQIEVFVKHVAEGNNYKEFHIEHKTLIDRNPLDIKKGTRVRLTYAYDVPLDIWGTYLNRYITYWREASTVTVLCTDKQKLISTPFKLFKTNENGVPVLVQGI